MGTTNINAGDYSLEDEKAGAGNEGIAIGDEVDVDDFDTWSPAPWIRGSRRGPEHGDDSGSMEGPIIKIVNGILIKAIKLGPVIFISSLTKEPFASATGSMAS